MRSLLVTLLAGVLATVIVAGALNTGVLAAGRCATSTGSVQQRVAIFWGCVNALGPSDPLVAEDLGQWARNVTELDPRACITVGDFRDSTAAMQSAIDSASAGISPAPPKSPDVESRIAVFWSRIGALGPLDFLAAGDVGQWALNVIDRDPSRQIRVDDFRASAAGMQTAFDRAKAAGASCTPVQPAPTPTPTASPTPRPATPTPTPTPTPTATRTAAPTTAPSNGLVPGDTLTDPILQRDILAVIRPFLSSLGCQNPQIVNTVVVQRPVNGRWMERWYHSCLAIGGSFLIAFRGSPGGGTDYVIAFDP